MRHRWRHGKLGRPFRGDLCLLCATRPRMHLTDGAKWHAYCAECNRLHVEAKHHGTAAQWLFNRKREYETARKARDRLLLMGAQGLQRIAQMARQAIEPVNA